MVTLEPIDLLRLKLSLEFSLPSPTRLSALHSDAQNQVPRLHVSRLPQGYALHFHHETPQRLVESLTALGPDRLFGEPKEVQDLLGDDGWSGRRWTGRSDPVVSAHLERSSTPERAIEVRTLGRRFELWEGDHAVAWAWSVRENDHAAEVAIGSAPDFRREKAERWVVRTWANSILHAGKVALVSWSEADSGSRELAQLLEAKWYATSVTYS